MLFELSFELRFTTLRLGAASTAQPAFPENRHLARFHRQPYCL